MAEGNRSYKSLGSGAEGVIAGGNAQLEFMVGKDWLIVGLTSERGKQINGKCGRCLGFDPFPVGRLHIRVPGFDAPFKLKVCNLLPPEASAGGPPSVAGIDLGAGSSEVDAEAILRVANVSWDGKSTRMHIQDAVRSDTERLDVRHRATRLLSYFEELLDGKQPPAVFGCGEAGDAAANSKDPFLTSLMGMKPPCVGNGKFSMDELFAAGADDLQAARRLAEYPLSGFCVRCQRHYMEGEGE